MRILHISDIHGDLLPFYNACTKEFDVMVFTGDFFPNIPGSQYVKSKDKFNNEKEFQKLFYKRNEDTICRYLKGRPLIYVMGNHDFISFKECGLDNCFELAYKNDLLEINGVSFWGFSEVNEFTNYHWNNEVDKLKMSSVLDSFPDQFDVLCTHGAPLGVLDENHIGIKDLKEKALQSKIKLHLFGHCHLGNGLKKINQSVFVNSFKKSRAFSF